MAAKLLATTTTLLVLGLIGSAQSESNGQQQQQQQGGPLGNLLGSNGPLGAVTGLLGGGQGGQGAAGNPLSSLNGMLGGGSATGLNNILGPNGLNNLLGSLPGGLGGPNQLQQLAQYQQGGLGEMIRRLPQRGVEALQAVLNSVRNMLPGGLGRNGQQGLRNPMDALNGGQNMMNMPNPFANGQMQMPGGDALGLNGLTRPVTDLLQNRQLPDVSQLTNQLTRTLSGGQGGMSLPNMGTTGAQNGGANIRPQV